MMKKESKKEVFINWKFKIDGINSKWAKIISLFTIFIAVTGLILSIYSIFYTINSRFAKIEISPSKFVINNYLFESLLEDEEQNIELTIFNSGNSDSGYVDLCSFDNGIFSQSSTNITGNIPPKQSIRITIPFKMRLNNEKLGDVELDIRIRCENCKEKEGIQSVPVCIGRSKQFMEDCPTYWERINSD